jgi:hypothetical protein
VTTSSPPLTFQTFDFTGFTGLASVSWDQGADSQGIHQFGNIQLSTNSTAVPEPSMLAADCIAVLVCAFRRKARAA